MPGRDGCGVQTGRRRSWHSLAAEAIRLWHGPSLFAVGRSRVNVMQEPGERFPRSVSRQADGRFEHLVLHVRWQSAPERGHSAPKRRCQFFWAHNSLLVYAPRARSCRALRGGRRVDIGERHQTLKVACSRQRPADGADLEKWEKAMVGATGIEPVATAMSRQCSTAELRAHHLLLPGSRTNR